MTDDHSRHDEAFETDVRRALSDPIPTDVVSQSIALGALLDMDHALAELTHRSDSEDHLAGVRGDDQIVATLTFETKQLVVEVEIGKRSRELTGQVLPPTRATVRLETPEQTVSRTTADGQGVFRLALVPSGPISLVIEGTDGSTVSVRTRWVVV